MSTRTRYSRKAQASLLLVLLVSGGSAMSYEQPEYTVVYQDEEVEYRQYEPYLVAVTAIEDARNADAASAEGFRRLFRYITGANKGQAKVSMTSPVSQSKSQKIAMTVPVQQSESRAGWTVSFMLPSEFTLETAPQPTDPRVYVRRVPGRLMAVRQFSGRWTKRNYNENEQALFRSLLEAEVRATGVIERAAYNGPFTLPFMRRNEVMVPVDGLPKGVYIAANTEPTAAY